VPEKANAQITGVLL